MLYVLQPVNFTVVKKSYADNINVNMLTLFMGQVVYLQRA